MHPTLPRVAPSLLALLVPLAAASAPARAVPPRTLVAAIEVDREQARLLSFTVKERPFVAPADEGAAPGGDLVRLEVALAGPGGRRFARTVVVQGLCLAHGPDAPAHVAGDTIRLHRETVVVELPELEDAGTLEVLLLEGEGAATLRTPLGFDRLDAARFTSAGGPARWSSLAFARGPGTAAAAGAPSPQTPGTVHWPEEYGDPDLTLVYGDATEVAKRINIVIVPDGYQYTEKATLRAHADALVAAFRARTPYMEHDPFLNYILVYAYSTESGTDQCDCAIVADTAMNTRFPAAGDVCGGSGNRCLFYGTGNGGPDCDPTTTAANIAAAELRAPARDATIVMVNTPRYGGCGGNRAVYSAANGSATEIGIHELGHSLAGLDDEYAGTPSCGTIGGVNTSTNASVGNWPEWIADLGAPVQGARYYDQCVYRPVGNCEMRALGQPFCAVCSQQWALRYFGHARVSPTAPIASAAPASPVATSVGTPTSFSVATRLATGPIVTNAYNWQLQGPGFPTPTTVDTAGPAHLHTFTAPGTYTLTCELIADTNFIKPTKTGANRDVATWTVDVCCCDAPPSFAGLASAIDLDPCAATGVRLDWNPATFGPAGGGYEVWRDGVRIASAVAGPPYVDVPGDALPHVYRVVAVSKDCGVADGNGVTKNAADAAAPSPVPPLGNVLLAVKTAADGTAHFSWANDAGADSYEVGRSESRDFALPIATVGSAVSGSAGVDDAAPAGPSGLAEYRTLELRCGARSAY